MAILPRFYVYILYRPDGRPFYVGKGQGNRIDNHETNARRGVTSRCCNTIRKIWHAGGEVLKQKVFETHDEHEAFAMERYLIASIGRDNLANITDGGEGTSGYERTPEWYANVQAAKVGKPRSEACKAKIRAALTGRTLPPEHVASMSKANAGKPWSERARQNITPSLRVPHLAQRGEKHHGARCTVEQVREVRQLYKAGVGPTEIARRMGMPRSTVKNILYSKRIWKWVDSDDGNVPT